MSKKLSSGLMEKQETARRQTVNAVLCAITELKAEGYSIKIKDLMERTGLSRSVFAKPHIRQVLEDHEVVSASVLPEQTAQPGLVTKNAAKTLRKKLKKKDIYIAALVAENAELRRECELLRGRLFLLMQRES